MCRICGVGDLDIVSVNTKARRSVRARNIQVILAWPDGLLLTGAGYPVRSICWMVGLEGDFNIVTWLEGTHGWAVTKFTSLTTWYVCSWSSSSSHVVTLNVIDGVKVLISGTTLS